MSLGAASPMSLGAGSPMSLGTASQTARQPGKLQVFGNPLHCIGFAD